MTTKIATDDTGLNMFNPHTLADYKVHPCDGFKVKSGFANLKIIYAFGKHNYCYSILYTKCNMFER